MQLGGGEKGADILRTRNRPRIGKVAITKTGAGDDFADKVKIGRREPSRIQLLPERVEIALLPIGQDDILAVRDAHLIKRILLCQIGNKVDLIGRSITRNAAHGLQADRGDGIAGLLVRGEIMPDPDREIWIAEVDVITQVSIIAGVTKVAADPVKFGRGRIEEIGIAHVCTPVTNTQLVYSRLLDKN